MVYVHRLQALQVQCAQQYLRDAPPWSVGPICEPGSPSASRTGARFRLRDFRWDMVCPTLAPSPVTL